jgi:hypothetical protein
MNAKKGGYVVQRIYRTEGRHPTEIATQVHLTKARMRRDDEERSQRARNKR